MKFLFLSLLLTILIQETESKHWALLIAGSNGWYNYRHQADICHSYQLLHKQGIPDENIVVMMYDDIAHNEQNPTPGIVINKPGGHDVYKGVLKDYTKQDVTPENFINVLKGNRSAMNGKGSGKVIDSGPDDNVFVYFTDHGAPNIIAFPTSELHAKDLNAAIKYMSDNNRYKKMVIYIEACESGSMFMDGKLPADIDVFATTAANGVESSYACYFDQMRKTYLGDVYSVKWMEDSDVANFQKETLETQYDHVRDETSTSHVQQFGDMRMGRLTLGLFQGEGNVAFDNNTWVKRVPITDAVPSPNVTLEVLARQIQLAKSSLERKLFQNLFNEVQSNRAVVRSTIRNLVGRLVENPFKQVQMIEQKPSLIIHENCYKDAVTHFRKHCFDFQKYEHALRHVYVLGNLCNEGIFSERILDEIEGVCKPLHF